jgi:hypothetical protein
VTVEEAAARFEALLMESHVDHDEMSREIPKVVLDLVNRMELIRFTVAEDRQPHEITCLIDEAAAIVDQRS